MLVGETGLCASAILSGQTSTLGGKDGQAPACLVSTKQASKGGREPDGGRAGEAAAA